MSLKRRKELLSWAQENKAWIIEDDYDGLFHFGTRMPPSLKSMDTQDNVIFLLSFWQALYPLTTLCCAVLPSSFMGIMQSAKRHTVSLTEDMAQLALADILNDGYLQKYFRKLERELAANRRALMYELKRVFGARVDVPHQTGGLCMMVRFRNLSSARLVNAAQSAGLPLASTKQFYCEPTKKSDGEVQISFAALPEASVRKTVEKFAALLD